MIIQVSYSAISELLIWRYQNTICELSDDYQVTDILPIFHHSTSVGDAFLDLHWSK
ncbi:hypothetical protein RhiirC2_804695 [Rhizophagus irregularis]|uniref:Uncharacterized protein n=1 Tax=Rhizophagus irregularis TaxID=588596 RepID=A0A2N1KXH9_9GLOM|nr:hypothetical protein RhiirC2_804695 [Rhizophagus irregularis]